MEAFEGEVKVEVVAPFCVGDGTALNEAEEFDGLPTKIVENLRFYAFFMLFTFVQINKICLNNNSQTSILIS